jgi:SAM-dependent methyltransferase
MGISPDLLDRLVDWGVRRGQRVLDIGTSELFCGEDPVALNRFLTHFGAAPYDDEELERTKTAFAAELFMRADIGYRAIDLTPYPHTIRLDLNRRSLPFWHRGRYDLVLNCGTTEHVLNQLNAFRLIHDACKVGGLMYHGVPMAGDFWHGFISYNPKFFTRVQEANGYEIVQRWIWAADERRSYDEVELARLNREFSAQDAWVNFLLRRTSKAPFKAPSDLVRAI